MMSTQLVSSWGINEQHEFIVSANCWALKHIKQSAKKSTERAGDKALCIPVGTILKVNNFQDNYKSKLFVMVSQHQDPYVYISEPINGKETVQRINCWQLFELEKFQEDVNQAGHSQGTNVPYTNPR